MTPPARSGKSTVNSGPYPPRPFPKHGSTWTSRCAGPGLESPLVTRHRVTRRRATRAGALVVVSALSPVLLGGCSGQGNAEVGNAETAATTFSRDVAGATDDACGLLAPQTLKELEDSEGPCATTLPDELKPPPSEVVSAEVYGKDAIVRMSSDTIFLARYRQGWRVTAAGCTRPEVGRPYDCKVKGT